MTENFPDVAPRVLAVVVTHNGEPWLADCLKGLAAQVFDVDVVVVDSGSDASPATLVQKTLPQAEFIRINRNVGFGAAANHGLETSQRAPDADYFLFIHDDVELEPEATSLLVATALETEAGIVGGKGIAWDHPEELTEVGMSADQFGFPFSGLEEGEIDQGQHDTRRETLYVSSACMFTSKALVERVGLWDGAYFAFGEDLDLCTRARISGFKVFVQPAARFRHAVALATRQRRTPVARKIRYYTRRNRPRTIVKNVAAYRMPFLLMIYTFLAFAEMVALIGFRRFEELPAYPRALGAFIASIPEVTRRRRAVQKRRAVPDRRLRRFMVRDLHRARVFLERRARDWERGTLALGTRTFAHLSPTALKNSLGRWLRKPGTLVLIAVITAFLFATRRFMFGGTIASGSLWPFPQPASRLLGDYLVGWRDVRLGTISAAPDSFPLFWLASVLSFGKTVLAQKVLVFGSIGLGLVGVNRFVGRRTDLPAARILAIGAYALGPVVATMLLKADLQALVLYAALPFMLEICLRMLTPVPGPQSDRPSTPGTAEAMITDAMRLSLLTVMVVALAPSAFIAVTFMWLVICGQRLMGAWDRGEILRRSAWVMSSLIISLILMLPWSLEAMRPHGAILAPLLGRSGSSFHALWRGRTFVDLMFLDPEHSLLVKVVTATIVISTLLLATASRRREARLLATVWIVFALAAGFAARGLIPTPVASPEMWMTIPLACIALMAGHMVSGTSEELPRHAFGWRHLVASATALLLLVSFGGGWLPTIAGWLRPGSSVAGADTGKLAASISSFLVSTAEQSGDFRVLWLGPRWVDPVLSGARGTDQIPYLLTGPDGLTLLDSGQNDTTLGEQRVESTLDALVGRRLHLAGHLLAPSSIRFIVVDPDDDSLMSSLRIQRDIALEQQQGGIALFRNIQWLPRAVLAPVNLVNAVTAKKPSDRDLMKVEWAGGRSIPKTSQESFDGELPRTRHSQLLLGENFNRGWKARVSGVRLAHSQAFGWSNRFELPSAARGEISIVFERNWVRILWLVLHLSLLAIGLMMARSSKAEVKGWLR